MFLLFHLLNEAAKVMPEETIDALRIPLHKSIGIWSIDLEGNIISDRPEEVCTDTSQDAENLSILEHMKYDPLGPAPLPTCL